MAVRFKRKAVTFISSVGVVGGLDHPEPVLESELGTNLATQHPGSNGYAIGSVAPLLLNSSPSLS